MDNDYGDSRGCLGGCFSRMAVIVLALVVVSQFQPVLVDILGGVGGSFGLSPVSDICVGLPVDPQKALQWFAQEDVETQFGTMHIRIWIDQSHLELNRPYCLGTNIWGEE